MNSSIDLKTDAQGKFTFSAGLKYLYNAVNWIAVIVQIDVPPQILLGINGEESANGIKITRIAPKTSAGNADIKINDIITDFDGIKITDMTSLRKLITKHVPGDEVKIKIQRDSKEMELSVKMLADPEESEQGLKYAFDRALKPGERESHLEVKLRDINLRLDYKINQ